MTKSELIKRISDKYSTINLRDATIIVETIFDEISNTLEQGGRVELRGFGSFTVRERKSRKARNPRTGEVVDLGARNSVYFRAGKELKESVDHN